MMIEFQEWGEETKGNDGDDERSDLALMRELGLSEPVSGDMKVTIVVM